MVEPMCAQKSLKFVVVRRQECGGCILADKIRINQIVLNLLTNAVKYTPAGGTVTYVSDSERLANCKMRFGFEVRDTGIGMVDRLVEHKPVSKNRNAEKILRNNAAECQAIARLLKKLEKKFAVIIPDDELANVFEILQK